MLIWERRIHMFLQESWFRHFNQLYLQNPRNVSTNNTTPLSSQYLSKFTAGSPFFIGLIQYSIYDRYIYWDTKPSPPQKKKKSLKFGKQSQDLGLLHKYCTLKGFWVLIGTFPLFQNPNPRAPVACNTCPKPEVILVSVKRITNRDLSRGLSQLLEGFLSPNHT